MFELFEKYYNLFAWENGDNTCFEFTFCAVLILSVIVIELFCKLKKKSWFF